MAIKSMGIVGCGAIGKALIKAVEDGKLAVRVAAVFSRTKKMRANSCRHLIIRRRIFHSMN